MMMVSVSKGSLRIIRTILEAEFLMVGGTKDKLVSFKTMVYPQASLLQNSSLLL
jgi:hypothetical protein